MSATPVGDAFCPPAPCFPVTLAAHENAPPPACRDWFAADANANARGVDAAAAAAAAAGLAAVAPGAPGAPGAAVALGSTGAAMEAQEDIFYFSLMCVGDFEMVVPANSLCELFISILLY